MPAVAQKLWSRVRDFAKENGMSAKRKTLRGWPDLGAMVAICHFHKPTEDGLGTTKKEKFFLVAVRMDFYRHQGNLTTKNA